MAIWMRACSADVSWAGSTWSGSWAAWRIGRACLPSRHVPTPAPSSPPCARRSARSSTTSPRDHLRSLAAEARKTGAGVWADDATAHFALEGPGSIGPEGQLILPKLFRRATDYIEAVAGGFRGNLADWLVAVSTSSSRNEDDRVLVCGRTELRLSDLLVQANDAVWFQADPLDLVFFER